MTQPQSIQEVLDHLDIIIDDAIANNDRAGIFAFVYRRTTAEIQKEIRAGSFEDAERLERMDVVFANLYLKAYQAYHDQEQVSDAWKFAFASSNEPLTILQHIILGMNTHINLDLAIATSSSMKGYEISEIEGDFNHVNDVLFNIVNEMQDRLGKVSPLLFLLDWAGKNTDEKIIDFSMRKARQQSWNSANLLWALESEQAVAIQKIDRLVLKLGAMIKSPRSKLLRYILKVIGWFDEKNVGTIISRLKQDGEAKIKI
ncbi:DUF5995 family protein [Pareuzebyella sediminis]|uniref:DUF5995 family protein n=1 Tax=Pareuzebyella sediminis TaxID=2607998 RepID=UPI0011EF93DD|nr:DUF5995 family protein [Pareuzebyella sediminis]